MKVSEIIKNDGIVLIRPKKVAHEKGSPVEYDVKDAFTGKKKGWVYLDAFTKSAMRAVYNALSDQNKAKYDNIPITKIIDFTWKYVS